MKDQFFNKIYLLKIINIYDYLLKIVKTEDLSFYMIPNLDINDRFLINAKNVINKDLYKISKIL